MTPKPRAAVLLSATLLHAACSAEERTGNSAAASEREIASARVEDDAPGRELDARTGPAMARERIIISTDSGRVAAELVENDATRALVRMLPLTIAMRDHLGQEKTGNLPSSLPEQRRQTHFSAGMLGLWGPDDFVIYYRGGQVPSPGIVVLGRVTGDLAIFDRPGSVVVRIERAD